MKYMWSMIGCRTKYYMHINMCFVLFISNELHFAKAYYQSFYLRIALNSKVFELQH